MTVSELLSVCEYHCCGVRIQNDAWIDDGKEVLYESDYVDSDIRYSELYDFFIDEEVTDLYAESNGTLVICINKDKEDE